MRILDTFAWQSWTYIVAFAYVEHLGSHRALLACSQDIFSLFHLNRPFKFVSKTSNFYIPIVGWSMFLTGASPCPCLQPCMFAGALVLQ